MKRVVVLFVCFFSLFGASIYAQDWLLGGSVYFDTYSWEIENGSSDKASESGFSLLAGKYLGSKFALAFRANFNFYDDGSYMAFGPWFRYDVVSYEKMKFSIAGSIRYGIYDDSYSWNDTYNAVDANRILAILAPQFTFSFSRNVELYWEFMQLGYVYTWLTFPNSTAKASTSDFYLSGPYTNPNFGLVFRF